MESKRRNFLKIAGVTAVGLWTKPTLDAFASSGQDAAPQAATRKGDTALTAKHWGMVIDTREYESAEDLEPIIEACVKAHNVPDMGNPRHEVKWIWEEHYHNAFPGKSNPYMNERVEHLPFLVLCNHCEDPPCCQACPTQATFQREDGIVLMDFHRCIGCRFCMAACPYGSRSFNFKDPRQFVKHRNPEFPFRMKGVVEKCNFCAERLAVGKMPACVDASDGAIAFGDLDDPESEVRVLLKENYTIRRKQGLGTGPSVYYIV